LRFFFVTFGRMATSAASRSTGGFNPSLQHSKSVKNKADMMDVCDTHPGGVFGEYTSKINSHANASYLRGSKHVPPRAHLCDARPDADKQTLNTLLSYNLSQKRAGGGGSALHASLDAATSGP